MAFWRRGRMEETQTHNEENESEFSENVIAIRTATTFRSAMFRLKRAVYAQLRNLQQEIGGSFDFNKSKDMWSVIARKLVDVANEKGISDRPARIILEYELVDDEGKIVALFTKAKVETYELVDTFTVEP